MQSPSLPEPMLRCAASTSSDQVRPLVPPTPVLVPDDDEATTYTATYRTLQRFDALDKLFKPKAPTTTKGCKPRWPSIFNKVKGTVEGAVEAVISPTTLIYSSLADAVFLNADAGCPRLGSASRRSPASRPAPCSRCDQTPRRSMTSTTPTLSSILRRGNSCSQGGNLASTS